MKKQNLFMLAITALLIHGCGSDNSNTENSDDPNANATITVAGMKYKIIPGVQAVDVHGNFTNKGFVLTKNLTSDPASWICQKQEGNDNYTVSVFGKSASDIGLINGNITSTSGQIEETSRDFIGYMASVPYKGSNPQLATNWAVSHLKNGGDTIISGVTFKLDAFSNTIRSLTIYREAENQQLQVDTSMPMPVDTTMP